MRLTRHNPCLDVCDSHGPARWTRRKPTRPQKECIGHRPSSTSLSFFAIMLGLEKRARARMLVVVANEAAWKLTICVLKLKKHERATFYSPSENRCLPASTLNFENENLFST